MLEKSPKVFVEDAQNAFKLAQQQGKNSLKFRRQQLRKLLAFFTDHRDALIRRLLFDVRKEAEEAYMEIIIAVNHISYLINNLDELTRPEKVKKRLVDFFDRLYVVKEPYGVVLVMAAWNVPILTTLPVAGAIAAGNAVIIKPSHLTPNYGEYLLKHLPEYLDTNLYQVFTGDIDGTNQLLKEKFDYIYYTGSTTVGRIIHQAANQHLTPVTLELGGKNPVFIDNSVDIKLATRRLLWGKLMNSGQICVAPDYILCSKEIQLELLKFIPEILQEFYNNTNRYFPIINQLHYERIVQLMDGLKITIGGLIDSQQRSIQATIITDAPPEHPIMQEEIFGPILIINQIETVDQAIDFINQRPKPLTLYVFSTKSKVKEAFIQRTSSGSAVFNDTLMHIIAEELPFGGVGNSGMGLYKGVYSVDTFTHKKSVLDKNNWVILEKLNRLRYPPYQRKFSNIVAVLLKTRKNYLPVNLLIYISIFCLGAIFCYLLQYLLR